MRNKNIEEMKKSVLITMGIVALGGGYLLGAILFTPVIPNIHHTPVQKPVSYSENNTLTEKVGRGLSPKTRNSADRIQETRLASQKLKSSEFFEEIAPHESEVETLTEEEHNSFVEERELSREELKYEFEKSHLEAGVPREEIYVMMDEMFVGLEEDPELWEESPPPAHPEDPVQINN